MSKEARRKSHRSFVPVLNKNVCDADAFDLLLEVYSKCRSENGDRKSTDEIVAITPCPALGSGEDKALKVLNAKLRGLTPKHQKPKNGEVELPVKARRGTFAPLPKDVITTVCEMRQTLTKRKFTHIEGTSCVNKWVVVQTPDPVFFETTKVASLFPDGKGTEMLEDMSDSGPEDGEEMGPRDAKGMPMVNPYPREKHHSFWCESGNSIGRSETSAPCAPSTIPRNPRGLQNPTIP